MSTADGGEAALKVPTDVDRTRASGPRALDATLRRVAGVAQGRA